MRGLILAAFSGALTVMVPAVAAQQLDLLEVYAGFLSEAPRNFDGLELPKLALSPDYEKDTTSYAATLPFSASGISLVALSPPGNRIVGAEGKTPDGTSLNFSSWTGSANFGRTAGLISFDSVPAGEATIRLAVEFVGDRRTYAVVVNRATEVSASASLTQLELAAAERRSAFELTPEFDTGTTHYAVEVPGRTADLRLVTVAEHAGSVVDVRGVAADGQPLALDGSRLSGLLPGTNTLEITVTAEDGMTTTGYTVAVTRARPAVDATRAVSNEDPGGACVVGLELSPGQSCTHSAAGTFTVLEGGCANVSSIPIGMLCGADINANGLRATPVNDVNFRIDAVP